MSSSSQNEKEEPPHSESPVNTPTKPSLVPKPKRLHKTLSVKSFPTFWKQKSSKKDEKGEHKESKSDGKKGKKEDKTEARSEDKQSKEATANKEEGEEKQVKASVELRDSPLWKLPGLSSITRRHSTPSIDQVPQTAHSQSPRPTTEHPAEQVQECAATPEESPTPEMPPISEVSVQSDSLPDIPETLDEPPDLPPRPESPLDLPSDQTDSDMAPKLPHPPPTEESEKMDIVEPIQQTHSSEEHPEPGNATGHAATVLASTEEPTALPPSDIVQISITSDATPESLAQTENTPTTAPTNPEATSNSLGKCDSSGTTNVLASPKIDPTLRPLPEIPPHLRPLPKTPPPPHTEITKFEKRPKPPPKPDHLTQKPGSPTSSQDTTNEQPVQEKKPLPAVTVEVSESPPSTAGAYLPENLSVGELVNKYSKKFPLRIKVLQGYSEETSELNISTDDVYDIHFIKHTKVVKIKDEDSYTYSLPLGSAMKFGFVYNPDNKLDEALSGFSFERIADISAMATLPKVVCATKSYQTSDDKVVIEENEIFAVRHVHRTKFKGKKGLKVFSVLSKTEKVLPEECVGHFSTKPSLVRMHLPEIIEYIQIPFPSQAVMYHGGHVTGSGQSQPATQSRVVTMCDCSTETSLVASLVAGAGEEEENGDQQLFDIPVDENSSEIEVKILKCSTLADESDEEPEHIYDDTINVLHNFDPTKLQSLRSANSGSKGNLQSLLLTNVREGYEHEGIEVESPYVNITAKNSEKQRYSDDDDPDNPYDTVCIKRQASSPSKRNSAGYDRVGDKNESQEDPRLTCWLEDLQSSAHALDSRMRSLENSKQTTELNK